MHFGNIRVDAKLLRLIDDIVIFSKTKDERANLLQEVLEKLLKKEVRINFDKSKFFMKELKVYWATK